MDLKRRRIALPLLALFALLATAGCMTDNGKNDPLPVKSKSKAEHEVRALIDLLADEIGSEVDTETVDKNFHECRGRQGEEANDGRFDLGYSVAVPQPRAEYNSALKRLRKRLEAEGYKVSDYREGDWRHVLLYAKGGNANYFVSVGASKPPYDEMTLAVKTPCFLPPGVEQEQVSAPLPRPQGDATPEVPVAAAPQTTPTPAQDEGGAPPVMRPYSPY
ncbi:hypothetical protein QIS99_09835 [Streptomyces sp. B-S-A8]|uniref:Uncharacterized protein n=1 Tax=Streptomyces solicavernae TaxID=3043614 RepID=A0ABT6RQ28_9ACTN|nr:hypothetical protein [Streptomyces sp. B-S-A8]MDI3386512.1 hypothetical protein [Streptomyces sp. B-S-A8]